MPLITLSTDLGIQDFVPGAIKGRLLQVNDSFQIIDITHQLSPYNFPQAAYICKNVIQNYPVTSLHIILVNVFDDRPKHMLLAEHKGQYIGCADNGLLTMVLEEEPEVVVAIPFPVNAPKTIFTCAGIIADAYNKLLQGKKMEQVGNEEIQIQVKNPFRPKLGADWMEGQIIFIDNFENVVVNITQEAFEEQRKGRKFKIVFKRDEVIDKISDSYADVQEGEKLAIFNSAGYLEIAINKGNAAGLLGLQGYSEHHSGTSQMLNNRLIYQMVKIHFE